MLTEVESLFLLLAVLYGGDCLWWLSWNSCIIEQWWPGGKWRLRSTSDWAATRAHALIAVAPWPTGIGLEVGPRPLSLSPSGFLFWNAMAWTTKGRPRQSIESWAWPEVRSVEARGDTVFVNGEAALTKSSERTAAKLAGLLDEVRSAPDSQREELITRLRWADADPTIIAERLAEVLGPTRCLRWGGAAQATLLFVIAPLVLARFGGPPVLVSIAAAVFMLTLFNAAVYWKLHRKAYPTGRWERTETALVMCLCWPVAARAAAALCRHRLADFDPLAVILVFDSLPGRALFLNKVLRDLAYPLQLDELPPQARSIVEWQLQWEREHIRRMAARAGVVLAEDGTAKNPLSSVEAYCPRCQATYSRRSGECSDCPGVELHDRCHEGEKGASTWTNPTAG